MIQNVGFIPLMMGILMDLMRDKTDANLVWTGLKEEKENGNLCGYTECMIPERLKTQKVKPSIFFEIPLKVSLEKVF